MPPSVTPPSTTPRKFPFWITLGRAYASIVRNGGPALRAMLPVLLVYCALSAALHAWQFSFNPTAFSAPVNLVFYALDEAMAVLLAAIAALKWHRFVVLGEPPSWLAVGDPRLLAEFVFVAMVVWLAASGPVYALLFGNEALVQHYNPDDGQTCGGEGQEACETAAPDHWGVTTILALLALVLLLPAFSLLAFIPLRWALAMPDVAVGNGREALSRAWHRSRGNFWRLFWGTVLIFIAATVIGIAVSEWFGTTSRAHFATGETISSALTFVCSLVWISFLSHAYRALAPGDRAVAA